MSIYSFNPKLDYTYHWSGKFIAPGEDWIHLTRDLKDYELMVVTEGTLYIASDRAEFAVCKGEYLLMPPTSFQHGYKSSDCSFYWLHFSYNNDKNDHTSYEGGGGDAVYKDYVTSISEKKMTNSLIIPETKSLPHPDRLIVLMKQLQDSDMRYKNADLNSALAKAILLELSMQLSLSESNKIVLSRRQTFEDICDYISWHIGDSLTVAGIADYFGYNKKYLTTFFKARSGISLKQYILSLKMERAAKILSESATPVSRIAYSLGFSDNHNFSNAFKKVKGLSPTEYRNTYNTHNFFIK
ncbi:MAG: AraC family transcriptional regulator [Lachnospiraceae bacterium]|nr:AraC family transcriptional regulator [Lachnospiraceae bacterium]